MAVFMLETDALTSASGQLKSVGNEVIDVGSSVSSYDTSCEDGFDFKSAQSAIAQNIDACSTKIQNTCMILEQVVSAHTELQNGLKFDGEAATKKNNSNNDKSNKSTTSNASTNRASNNANTGSTRSTGGGGSYGGGGSSGGGGSTGGGATPNYASLSPAAATAGSLANKNGSDSKTKGLKAISTDKDMETSTNANDNKANTTAADLKKVGYAYANSGRLTDESNTLMKDDKFSYDKDGYAKLGDKYVVSCDSSVGKVGDVVRFTKKDGTSAECVIGVNTESSKYKNNINFLVDEKQANNIQANDVSKNLLDNNKIIENCGNYKEYDAAVSSGKVPKGVEIKSSVINNNTTATTNANNTNANTGTNTTTTTNTNANNTNTNTGTNTTTTTNTNANNTNANTGTNTTTTATTKANNANANTGTNTTTTATTNLDNTSANTGTNNNSSNVTTGSNNNQVTGTREGENNG